MWKTKSVRLAACTMILSTKLFAQRQTETMLGPRDSLSAAGGSAAEELLASATVSVDALNRLVGAACPVECDRSEYTIVHLVRWSGVGIQTQKWLLLPKDFTSKHARDWSSRDAASARIFGAHDVSLLTVQIAAPSGMEYRIDVVKKEAQPVTALKALLELAVANKVRTDVSSKDSTWRFSSVRMNIEHVPSDIQVQLMSHDGTGSDSPKEVSKQTFDNESKYHWDVSVGVPVKRVSQLEYVAADGVVRTREIDKQSLTAFLNLHLIPVDTKAMRWRLFPSLLLGTSLSSRPLDRLVTALAIGTSAAQLYAGVAFERVDQPQTLATGAPATEAVLQSDLRSRYKRNFIVGLNVPVRQIVDRLAAQK
jgi:hypothetical protein